MYRLTAKHIEDRLSTFVFDEISEIIKFLKLFCGVIPEGGESVYIYYKVSKFLSLRDNKSDDFIPLRELAAELYMISLGEMSRCR